MQSRMSLLIALYLLGVKKGITSSQMTEEGKKGEEEMAK